MLLCLSLIVFVHGFSQTDSYVSLFISCCFCSWFLTGPTQCFFVYLLLFLFMVFLTELTSMLLCLPLVVFVHGFSHRTNSYASFFILYFLFMVSHFLALTTLTVRGKAPGSWSVPWRWWNPLYWGCCPIPMSIAKHHAKEDGRYNSWQSPYLPMDFMHSKALYEGRWWFIAKPQGSWSSIVQDIQFFEKNSNSCTILVKAPKCIYIAFKF